MSKDKAPERDPGKSVAAGQLPIPLLGHRQMYNLVQFREVMYERFMTEPIERMAAMYRALQETEGGSELIEEQRSYLASDPVLSQRLEEILARVEGWR